MIIATQEDKTRGRFGRAKSEPEQAAAGESLMPPPKLRRRPLLVAASVAVVCLGALLGVFAWSSLSDGHQVVAARSTIARGQVITREALVVVRVGADPGLSPVPAEQIESLVGRRAALDVSGGSLLTAAAASDAVLPASGLSVVGVAVGPGGLPGPPLLAGDRVRVVLTPGAQGTVGADAQQTLPAMVVSVAASGDGGPGTQSVLSVQVPAAEAARLAAWAATGKVAVVLDSRER